MQPKRQAGPIRRTIIAPPVPATRPGANPLLRTITDIPPAVQVRRTRAVKMTGAQRDTTGKRSDWNLPQNLRPFTTPMTAAWSRTASDFKTTNARSTR